MLPARLLRRAEFLNVAARGRKIPMSSVVVQVMCRDGVEAVGIRVGYTVTKKVGNSVVRNRVRRRLRAAMGQVMREMGDVLVPVDIVLIGRKATQNRCFAHIVADVRSALRKAGVFT